MSNDDVPLTSGFKVIENGIIW